ncbi:hypothetical protein [Magnetococcus sp. PR-3]|uniref:hypothetical protein n=1 Tax=Magnetococcus sp. PR-3 TaxID=3120355 RepID=UPI002FCE3411
MNATDDSIEELESYDEEDDSESGGMTRFGITRGQAIGLFSVLLFMIGGTTLYLMGFLSMENAFDLGDRVNQTVEMEKDSKEVKESKKRDEVAITGKKSRASRKSSRASKNHSQAASSQNASQGGQQSDQQPVVQGIRLENIRVGSSSNHYPPAPKGERRALSSLSNSGEHALTGARVVMEFLDRNDKPVEQRTINPLVVAGGVLGDVEKPIAPGERRPFAASLNNISSSWSGKVRATVEGMQFKGWDTAELHQ